MKKVLLYFLIAFIFVFTLQTKNVVAVDTVYEIDSSGNYYFDYVSLDTSSYYSDLNNVSEEDFKEQLHYIISSGEITRYSYSQVTNLLKELDEDLNNSENIMCVLTGRSMAKDTFGENGRYGWNREHIWPKSHGFNAEGLSAYTDLHHMRAAEAYTNSTFHNDYDYGVVEGGASDDYGNKYVNKTDSPTGYAMYEPRDAVKGDIARMIMYMDVRYEGDDLSDNIELSIAENNSSPSSLEGYIGSLDVLLQWHINDPVDDLERRRNDMVYEKQGNRNPFVDHPEYANIIYDTDYDVLEENEYRVLYYVSNGTFDYVDLMQYKNDEFIIEPSVLPISERYDYTFKGWSHNGELFDFENSRITGQTKLYAVWEYTPLPPNEVFARLNTLSGLHLKYSLNNTEDKPILQTTQVTISSEGGSSSMKVNQEKNCDEFLEYNKNDLEIIYCSNGKTSCYVGKGQIKLYPHNGNGTSIKIVPRDGSEAKIVDFTYKATISNGSVSLENAVSKTIASDNSYAELKNIVNATTKNQIIVTSITITYYTETVSSEPVFDNVSLLFGAQLDKELYDDLLGSGTEVSFGIKINNQSFDLNPIISEDGVTFKYDYSVSNYSTLYEAKFFVTIDSNTYYMNSCKYSVKTMAENYILNHINLDLVYAHKIALLYILNS